MTTSISNKYNSTSDKFTYKSDNLCFIPLRELYDKNGCDEIYTCRGMWVNPNGKYGRHGVLITSDWLASVPEHLTHIIDEMLVDDALIEACNDSKFGFKLREYTSSKKEICITFVWVDID